MDMWRRESRTATTKGKLKHASWLPDLRKKTINKNIDIQPLISWEISHVGGVADKV